jgi:predicted ATP-grasp superfamily ATP-dependent carboligase
MTLHGPRLLIVGASARAAAFSALRGGMQPICADLFADADLAAVCPTTRVAFSRYPRGLFDWLKANPAGPWLVTGALENWPNPVRECSRQHPLWGNSAEVLQEVRRPWKVEACLQRAGLPCPRVSREPPNDGRWLVKPLASAGGRGIAFWDWSGARAPRSKIYFQEFIDGMACSAVFMGDKDRAELLGVTRQLVGEKWLHAEPFHYCGSVGPLALDSSSGQAFENLGDALVRGFGLRGLFGVDCVLKDGLPWPVEVNPRYTASIEVLELATGLAALARHRKVFDPESTHAGKFTQPQTGVVAKAIVFARREVVVPADAPWAPTLQLPPLDLRDFADLPHAGERIETGQPIVTLFARGATEANCLDELHARVQSLDRWLFGR